MENPGGVEAGEDMLPEYDFTDAEVGKYAERYARAFRTVRLDADVFSTSEAVNEVLRPIATAIRARQARAAEHADEAAQPRWSLG